MKRYYIITNEDLLALRETIGILDNCQESVSADTVRMIDQGAIPLCQGSLELLELAVKAELE